MKKYIVYIGIFSIVIVLFITCTKIQNGFLSPTMQYSPALLVIPKGEVVLSNGLIPDGSSLPITVKWVHIYDSTGKPVDDMFTKTYPVGIWTQSYDPITDNTFAAIIAKRSTKELPPIILNSSGGVIESNSASLKIPSGSYTMDIQVSNKVGTQLLKNAMTLTFQDAIEVETAPQQGAFANGRSIAGTAPVKYFYNGQNNPFVAYNIVRFADTPNIFVLKFTDRNGVPFDAKSGEIIKRPATGLNPNPPNLQNLQDYAPDTYLATDTAIQIEYPLVPFPIASLGNGYNMYYNIKTSAVQTDSTSAWTSNPTGEFYQGTSDTHYLGTYRNGEYDYSIRVPMRIMVPGSYELTVKILNVVHR